MPFYWGDYLRDTCDLSTLQHGAYMLLIGHYWQHGGLPADEKQLAAITGLSPAKWKSIRDPIAAKFQDGWKHRRIEDELVKTERKMMQRAIAGSKGGTAAAIARAKAVAFATPRFVPNATANVQQPSTNHKVSNITTTVSEDTAKGLGNGTTQLSPLVESLLARKATA